jgi:tRNA-modifying protein YgfZ
MEAVAGIELDAQYRVLCEAAGFAERHDRALLAVRGAEAADYLQGQLTNDVEALAPGEGCYAALLDRKGRMQGDIAVLRRGDEEFLLATEGVAQDAVARHLDMYRIGRHAEVEDVSGNHTTISVIGPASVSRLGLAPLATEYASREERIAETTCVVTATDLGVDLLFASSSRDAVVAALRSAGIEPVSEEAAEIVRVERGRPRFGAEMTTQTIPQEAGINERAVSFTKGCYIGQETVARLHYKGKPNRHLRGLRLAGPVRAGDPVVLGDREVGAVGTSVLSPARGPIALAILRREAEPGAAVIVGETAGEVVELPF